MKILKTLLILLLAAQCAIGQEKLDATMVIERYLEAIGGSTKLAQIESLHRAGTQTINGDQHHIEEKILNRRFYSMERTYSKGKMKAMVSNGKGVNQTVDGLFKMPPYQVTRFTNDAHIFPELAYLEEGYTLKFHGTYELDAQTKCYEIGIRRPDSTLIFKEYNMETGLLEMIVNKKEKTRIIEYQEIDGILLPAKWRRNGVMYVSEKIDLNPKLEEQELRWNSEKEEQLVGRWEATIGENDLGQKQISYLEFTADRAGKDGIYLLDQEGKNENSFFSQTIVGWEWEGPKVKLNYYDPATKKLWKKYLIIKKMKSNKIVGYISDPEMEKKFAGEVNPILLKFEKIK